MGQGYSQTLPPGPGAIEAAELTDLTFEKPLGGARFLRTLRARHKDGVVVVKLCQKFDSKVSFKHYAALLQHERRQLRDIHNVLAYQRIHETYSFGFLVRQYMHTSLYDRVSIRPFLESIEKKWIAFQLLCAVRDCHAKGVFHGDIKSENVLVTSWGWVYLTDFASSFKPVYLPEDNPADFSFYYDTSTRRTCYVAPERFLAAGSKPNEDNVVQWNMDIFSLGCVLAELFTEASTFTLHQLFRYRRGEYDPTVPLLNKVDDDHVRALISSMIRLDPQERWHAQDYLDEYKSKAFPLYFYQHFHAFMQEITDPKAGRKSVSTSDMNNGEADDRIDRIYQDYELLSVSLGFGSNAASHDASHRPGHPDSLFPLQIDLPHSRHTAGQTKKFTSDNGTFILLNVITSSMRSVARASSKVRACELLLACAERLPDEAKLDRILPYIMPLLEDPNEMVLVATLRTMTQVLALVTITTPVNSFLFTQYIFPKLQTFVNSKGFKSHAIVRATYATCLASLAHSAFRFLDMMQALSFNGSHSALEKGVEENTDGLTEYHDAYDATRLEVLDQFEGQTKVFLTDNDVSVKRAFLTSVPSLCIFLGEVRASDVLLSHLNTYLNDPDWQLKCAFFKAIVGVAVYIGGARLEEFVLPLIVQALTDPQEFVVEQALRSLASMAELGLLQRPKTWELIDTIARFQMHPNLWIKEAASHFVSAAVTYLSVADVRMLVTPLIRPYLKVPVISISTTELLDALEKPLPRSVLDLALSWAQRSDRALFWKIAKDMKQLSYRGTAVMPPSSSVADLGPRSLARLPKNDEDEQWLGRLRNAGLRPEDEMKLLAFKEYIWRAAQRQKRESSVESSAHFEQIIPLTRLNITPHTVIFESDPLTYEHHVQNHADRTIVEALEEAATPHKDPSFQPLDLNGLSDDQTNGQGSPATLKPIDIQARRLSGLRKPLSGSLSSSPGSGGGLLGGPGDRSMRNKSSAMGLMAGTDLRSKTRAEVATDDVTAPGRLHTSSTSQASSPAPSSRQHRITDRQRSVRKPAHNYAGHDPTILKLLEAVYVDNFPIDAAEFGPLVQSSKRGPIPSSGVSSTTNTWRPQGQLIGVLAEHSEQVTRILTSPDHLFFLTGSDDGTVKVWDSSRLERNVTHRSRQTYRLGASVKVTSLCFIENTHSFACTGSDGSVHVVKVDVVDSNNSTRYGKLRVLREWQIPSFASRSESCVWSEHYRADSASILILATTMGRIIAVDLRYMSTMFELHVPAQHGTPNCFCISRKHDWLLIGTTLGVLELWDLRFLVRLRSWSFQNPAPITRLQLHPSRKTARRNRVCIAGGTSKGDVTVWDIEKLVCHEIFRPAHEHNKARLHLRDYELRNLEDDRSEGLLSRAVDPADVTLTTALHFGLQQSHDDTEALHTFALTGGPDAKVRFWDCGRLDGCRVVCGGTADEKMIYSLDQLGLDTRVITEIRQEPSEPASANKTQGTSSPSPRGSSSNSTGSKISRYEKIRTSAQQLLSKHLDTITDVALLERPFGIVLSADRSGRVFIHQ